MMRFIIVFQIGALRTMFVLALFLCLASATADTVAFLDGSFVKQSPPETLSIETYAALPSAVTGTPTQLSKDVGEELSNLIADDVFARPYITWNVVVFGTTKGEFFKEDVVSVRLTGKDADIGNAVLPRGLVSDCDAACIAMRFSQGMEMLGGSFTSGTGQKGVINLEMCGSELSIDDGALLTWATELGELWNDLSVIHGGSVSNDSPMHLRSMLTGLHLIRRVHGAHSTEFNFAKCVTRETLFKIHKDLEIYSNRGVFVSVLMHTTETEVNDPVFDKVVTKMGRQLLDVKWFSDSDPSKTVAEKTRRFSTNAAGYVIFLLIWFASLGGLYVICNMDFTKDTLLYSQAKID